MSDKSGIQWTDATWNPVTGCSKVSQGCKNCYALRDWARVAAPRPTPNVYTGREFTDVQFHPERLDQPLRWKKPRRVFVNSMSDLFHEKVPDAAIDRVFAIMADAPRHTFQVLTKRPERMLALLSNGDPQYRIGGWLKGNHNMRVTGSHGTVTLNPWPLPNVWLGVSVEDQATADERIPLLLQTPAAVRFVSYEPALGPVDFSELRIGERLWLNGLTGRHLGRSERGTIDHCLATLPKLPGPHEHGLDWLIVGGESGPGARPCDVAWVRSTAEQCKAAGVACFVKQLGAVPIAPGADIRPMRTGRDDDTYRHPMQLRDRKGGDPDEWPADLRVRDMPTC